MTKQDQESKETVDATSSKHSREPSFDEKVVQGIETASEPPKGKSKADAVEAEYEVESQETKENKPSFYQRHRKWMHLAMFLIFTGYLAAAFALQVPKGYNQENLVLGLIYAFFVLYILFSHVPITILTKPFLRAVSFVGAPIRRLRPMYQKILYVGFVAVVIIVVVFSIPPSAHSTRVQRLIGLFGLVVFVAGLYATSHNRRAINWNTVAGGLLIQFILGIFVFRTSAGHDMFQWLANFAQGYLAKSSYGAAFVFSDDIASSGMFVVNIVPPIILFCATAQILYYVGALPWVLRNAANIFIRLLGVSGAEAVVACSTCFLGQVESAMLVKPLLPNFTKAETHQILTCGFATISGSTLFAYISMGVDGQALITSSIMSIPCSLAVSKLRWPETDEPETKTNAVVAKDKESRNLLHAAGIGAGLGINISLLIIANLIAILALLHVVNAFLTWAGNFLTIQNLTLELITSYIFVPLAWLIGADNHNVVQVGELMATKLWANEFVAYTTMTTTYADILTERSRLVATYALCGFANLGSVGIQVGGLTMMAPSRAADISKLAVSALICGSLSTYISACIAGMLF